MIYNDAEYYEVYYTGTPPESQHFVVFGDSTGFIIKIVYSNSNSYQIQTSESNGKPISQTMWNDVLGTYEPLSSSSRCGDNRYLGTQNILEFYIIPGCDIYIKPLNAIQLGVRLDFDFDTFFEQGGVTTFIDNMAAVLGVHKADLKVVEVYEGSVIIDFKVIENFFAEVPIVLEEVQQTFETAAAVMDTFMGASVLGAVSAAAVVVTPNTPLNEDGSIIQEFINIWDAAVNPDEPIVEPDTDVKVEVRYKVSQRSNNNNTRESGRVAFVAILACILVIAGLIIFSVFLYRKIIASEPVDKAYVPENIQKQEEYEEHGVMEEQYTPYKA